jgi:hypothetical protein
MVSSRNGTRLLYGPWSLKHSSRWLWRQRATGKLGNPSFKRFMFELKRTDLRRGLHTLVTMFDGYKVGIDACIQ